jgi:transposase
MARALEGHYRQEHLFALQQALELVEFYQHQITACDRQIEACLQQFEEKSPETPLTARPRRRRRSGVTFDARSYLYRITGVDLTQIDSIEANTALTVIGEIGLDMSRWPTEKHFGSWLGLAPGTKVSGGKRLSGRTKPSANRAAAALRLAAQSLNQSQSALGAYFRRLKARLGAPKLSRRPLTNWPGYCTACSSTALATSIKEKLSTKNVTVTGFCVTSSGALPNSASNSLRLV